MCEAAMDRRLEPFTPPAAMRRSHQIAGDLNTAESEPEVAKPEVLGPPEFTATTSFRLLTRVTHCSPDCELWKSM
jgi:hypothetical protein